LEDGGPAQGPGQSQVLRGQGDGARAQARARRRNAAGGSVIRDQSRLAARGFGRYTGGAMKTLSMLAVLALLASPVRAEDRLAGLKSWFQHLKEGLADSSLSEHYQRHGSFAAVAAVRGAQQDAVDPMTPVFKSSERARRAKDLRAQRTELS